MSTQEDGLLSMKCVTCKHFFLYTLTFDMKHIPYGMGLVYLDLTPNINGYKMYINIICLIHLLSNCLPSVLNFWWDCLLLFFGFNHIFKEIHIFKWNN
jgi:hypothetical protein